MNRRLITNLGLLLLVAVLGLVAWLQPGLQKEETGTPLSTIDPASVSRLVVERTGFETVVLEKEAGEWMMREPVAVPASAARIDALLAVLAEPVRASFPAAEVDLASFGLDAPRVRLQVDGMDVAFGGTEPISHRRYVRIQDRVALIEDEHYIWLQGGASDFVSRQLLPPEVTITLLELPGVVLRRSDDAAAWEVTPAEAMSAEDAARVVREWQQAYALAVERRGAPASDDVKQIRLRLGDGRELEFIMAGDEDDLLFVRADLGVAWRVSAAQAARLLGESGS